MRATVDTNIWASSSISSQSTDSLDAQRRSWRYYLPVPEEKVRGQSSTGAWKASRWLSTEDDRR